MQRKISRVALWFLVVTALPVSAARKNKNLLQAEPAQAALSVEQQRKFQYFFLEAEKQKYLQHIDAAFDLFKHCYEIDSTSAIVCYELADGYLKMNNPAEAVDLVRKVSTFLRSLGSIVAVSASHCRTVSRAIRLIQERFSASHSGNISTGTFLRNTWCSPARTLCLSSSILFCTWLFEFLSFEFS